MQFSDFFKLVRFEHAIMLAIAVFIGETVVLGHIPEFTILILLSLLVPIFSEMGSFALNDYLDVDSDRLNKKTERPLVRGAIKPDFAFKFAWLAFIVSTVLAFFINIPTFVIALMFNAFAILYNYKLKDMPLLGNIYIASTMAIPFIFGNFAVSARLRVISLVLAMLGFISGIAREIVKSIQDMEGDMLARKAQTLPILIGRKNASIFAVIFYIMFIPLSYTPFLYGLKMSAIPMILIFIGNLGILYNILLVYKAIHESDKSSKQYLKKARNVTLAALFIGLVGYLAAVI
ncbi:UbiA family prenyltransferase [Candidatus Micrarchaeota archaeon]|nr:UbiA family prenyltransferase [Candidatus Micrarchaeota archaeon]